jgi:hypothetical protein
LQFVALGYTWDGPPHGLALENTLSLSVRELETRKSLINLKYNPFRQEDIDVEDSDSSVSATRTMFEVSTALQRLTTDTLHGITPQRYNPYETPNAWNKNLATMLSRASKYHELDDDDPYTPENALERCRMLPTTTDPTTQRKVKAAIKKRYILHWGNRALALFHMPEAQP